MPKKLKDCKIAFIITAGQKSTSGNYLIRHRARFNELGWNYAEIDIAGKTKTQLKKILTGYDIIFMGGGNTFYLLKCVRKSGFAEVAKDLIAQGVIYIGVSAGSYIACPSIIMSTWIEKGKDRYGITNFTAMNWVPFLIKAHYTPDMLDAIKEKAKQQPLLVRLLTDEQALVIKNEEIKFIGKDKEIILPGSKPKTIIVDENDKIIGYKERSAIKEIEIHPDKFLKSIMARLKK